MLDRFRLQQIRRRYNAYFTPRNEDILYLLDLVDFLDDLANCLNDVVKEKDNGNRKES